MLLSLISRQPVLLLSGGTNVMVVEVVELGVNILILGDEHMIDYWYRCGRCIPPQFANVVTSSFMVQILCVNLLLWLLIEKSLIISNISSICLHD